MFVNNDSNPVALSISLVKALLKLVGFAPAAAMLEGGQDLYQLLTDISNGSLGNPNAVMIRSLNSAMHAEIDRIEADLKNDGVDRTQVKQTLTTLLDATRSTIKNLSADESKLLEAIRNPDSFADLMKHEAIALPKDSDENTQNFYERLLEVVAAEFMTLTPGSPNFNRVALVDLIRCFPDWRDRIDRLEQSMNKRFDKVDEDNQEIMGLLREQSSSSAGRLIFGSRPDVVVGDRFVERDEQEQLEALITELTRQRTVLSGMRGCGKTQLAASLAKQCEDANWDLVAWINAISPESIKSELVELAKQLGIGTSDQPTQDQVIRSFLSRMKSAKPADRLIIFDNVEDINHLRGLIPSGDGVRVVATTTNDKGWNYQGWDDIRIGVFDREKSINYLLTETESADRAAADTLAYRLGDLPLAIAQAAATARNGDLSLARYLDRLDSYGSERAIHPVPGDYYTDDVATALCMAIEDALDNLADATRQSARRQLGALALLAESGVPTRWLDPTIEQQDNQHLQGANKAEDEDAHDALTELIHRSIVQQTTDKQTTILHRLQAQVLRESWNEVEYAQARESAAALLGSIDIDRFRADDSDARFQETHDLIANLFSFGARDGFRHLEDYRDIMNALCQAFDHARDLGLVPEVFALKELVNTLHKQVGDSRETLSLLAQLAYAHMYMSDYPTAIRLYKQVLNTCEQILEPSHRDILSTRNDLAYAYYWGDHTDEAIDLFKQVLDDRTRILSSDHEDTLMTGSYLALAYADDGQLERAIALGEQVVKDRDRVLKPDHKHTLVTRNNLANAYKSAGRLTDAIKMYEYVLEARIRTLGNTHHHTRITRNDLAQTYEQAGDLPKAISMYEDLHNDHIRIYGPDHESTIEVRDRLKAAKRELERQEDDPAAEEREEQD